MRALRYNLQDILYRPLLKSILIFLVALTVLSGSILNMINMRTTIPLFITGHSASSLLLAFDTVICHKKGYLTSIYEPGALIKELSQKGMGITAEPLSKAIFKINKVNNVTDYCSMLKTPYVNSENTWGWIMQPIFWIHPTISFHGLVLTLFIIQISMLWFFFYYLAHMRISGLYIFILSIVSISVTSKQMPYLIFTQYPMLLPGLLFPIALLGFSIRYKWYQRRVLHAVFSCGIGAYLFFLYNLRTPYIIPAVIVLAVYYLLLRPMRASSLYSFLLVIVTSIFCYISIQKSVFPPEFEKNKSLYLSTHPIAHPLVLGLAIPANRFAKKLGIEWNDSIGERIALNADPTVKLDSPKYDEVLLSYYKSLWVNYPKDMFRLYFEKFNSLGHDFAPDNRIIRLFMFPLNKLNGMMIMFIQFMILYLLLKNRNKLNACFLFGSLSFSLAGIALYIESGIIYSIYNACYHGFLTLWFVSLNLTFLSLLIYYLFHLIERKLLAGKHKRQDPLSSQLSS